MEFAGKPVMNFSTGQRSLRFFVILQERIKVVNAEKWQRFKRNKSLQDAALMKSLSGFQAVQRRLLQYYITVNPLEHVCIRRRDIL